MATEPIAKAKVQTRIFQNGPAYRLSVKAVVKFSPPTNTRQPTGSLLPSSASN